MLDLFLLPPIFNVVYELPSIHSLNLIFESQWLINSFELQLRKCVIFKKINNFFQMIATLASINYID